MKLNFVRSTRILVSLFTVILLVLCCASCGKETTVIENTESSVTDTTVQKDLIIAADGKSEYKIVRPLECDDHIYDAANALREYIKDKTGVNIKVVSDGGDKPMEQSEFEILVGQTNREESTKLYERLDYNGAKAAISGQKIIIAAYTKESTDFLVERVTRNFDVSDDRSTLSISELNINKSGSYDIESLKFDGEDLWSYGMVLSDEDELSMAKHLRQIIGKASGIMINVYADVNDLPDGIKPFYIGNKVCPTSTDGNTSYRFGKADDGIALYYTDASSRTRAYIDFESAIMGASNISLDLSHAISPSKKQDYTASTADIKIMSFNVLNGWDSSNIGNRDNLTASKILNITPDVIGLQEFDSYYRNASEDRLSTLISSKYAEVGEAQGSWNPIFYNKDTLTLLTYGFHTYTDGTEYKYPSGGNSMFRTFTWALFEEKTSGKQFLVFNTHLDYTTGNTIKMQSNQLSECKELTSKINELTALFGIGNVFMIGDFNTTIGSTTCETLFKFGFKDTHTLAQIKDDVASAGKKGFPTEGSYANAIDHIFCIGTNISVSEYKTIIDIRDASDHCPIYAILNLF